MREIKFRAWDADAGGWTDFGGPTKISFEGEPHTLDLALVCLGRNVVLCQFTGLKDKNGKEIYEGDIVYAPLNTHTYEVKFGIFYGYSEDCEKEFHNGFYLDDGAGSYSEDCDDGAYLVVIGNVHENPELLGGK